MRHALFELLNHPGRDERQQDLVMADDADSLATFGSRPGNHVGQRTIMFDEIQVDGCKFIQGIPEISHQGGGL